MPDGGSGAEEMVGLLDPEEEGEGEGGGVGERAGLEVAAEDARR